MREYTRQPEEKPFLVHVWLAQNWIGQHNYLAADVCPVPMASIQNNENWYPIRKLPSFLSKKTNMSSNPDQNLSCVLDQQPY
jgi:hypothetical protein